MNLKSIFVIVVSLGLFWACSSEKSTSSETSTAGEAATATEGSVQYVLNTEQSELVWKGQNIVGKTHHGTIGISEGVVSMDGDNIVAGEFVVDMNTLTDQDIENPEYNQKLVGHLKSDDFFDVPNHPTASFEITAVQPAPADSSFSHLVSGNLSIKGITKEIVIPATVSVSDGTFNANADFTFNRAEFDVRYGSGAFYEDLGDKLILDDVNISLKLVGAPQQANAM